MKKAAIKRTLGFAIVVGAVYAGWRAYKARVATAPGADASWEAAPFPFPPIPRPASTRQSAANGELAPSVEPLDGECPESHPVKGKLASGIYHVPGGRNYARTRPDRCYLDAAAAESDGLRAAKV